MSGQAAQFDPIAALATPPGGAIGILRLSGAGSLEVFSALTGISAPEHAQMRHCAAKDERGDALDDAMAVFFYAPNSYTGEDAAELHLHGSPAVLKRALSAATALGARVAEPGEFTKRAFLAGKLKLSEAEAVMDEIMAETDRGARTALGQLRGALTRRVGEVEDALTEALAAIDAAIDYPEELEDDVTKSLPEVLTDAKAKLEALINEGEAGRAVREGARVVIVGAPNAGKSTLLNALAGEERAIVTAQAGTTRDVLEAHAVICGVPVTLVDTAGLRDAQDEAERIGVERAKAAIDTADLLLWVVDGATVERDAADAAPTPQITVYTKSDIARDLPHVGRDAADAFVHISARTGENLPALRDMIAKKLNLDPTNEYPAVTNVRHITALKAAHAAIVSALCNTNAVCADDCDLDSTATDLRTALVALGAISGKDVDERVIEEIFQRFCVGK